MDVNFLVEKFIWFLLGLFFMLFMLLLFIYPGWRRLIWRSKGRVFRVVKENGDTYYPEKRFLWFFFIRIKSSYGESKRFWSKEEARDYIQKFLQDLKEERLTKRELIDFSNLKVKKEKEI